MCCNFVCIVILSFCVQSFLITDATKNILTQGENEISFKIREANTDGATVNADNKLNQEAAECDCGEDSIDCKIIDEKKICDCKEGYAQGNDKYQGICIATCNETQTCDNGGTCLEHLCVCLPGTFGVFCEKIHDCLLTDMCAKDDETICSYDVDRQKAYCNCHEDFFRFDDATKTCRVCLCSDYPPEAYGTFSWCDYQQGQQVCTCTEGNAYNPLFEKCEKCDCEANSTWCEFDIYGKKHCGCIEGFYPDDKLCKESLCGEHGIRNPKPGYLPCICDEGYTETEGVCVECRCGIYGICLYDEHNKQVGCKCQTGYIEKSGKCEKCYCGDNINCTFDGDRKVCGCESGYEDSNGFCTDINECEKHNPCKESMTCINLLGSYECICKEGYKPVIVDTLIKPYEVCEDIDECENASSPCSQPNSFCENTIGSYNCICESGFNSRGVLDSSLLCERSTATAIYTTVGIASFVSLVITGAVVYYVAKTFRGGNLNYELN